MYIFKHINSKILSAIIVIIIFFFIGLFVSVILETQKKVSYIKYFQPDKALKIIDRKDRLIANIFDRQFRYYAKFDEIPPRVIETLLAVEDTFFFEHNGVNFDAISRAMVKNLLNAKLVEGGSTITQQLVKNLALSTEKTIDRKLKEAILAMQIETKLSKKEILEKYINYIYFGHGYYGIKTAAQGYFKKDLSALSLKEIAMLIALPKAPSNYDPTKNLDLSLSRANSILDRMLSIGWVNKDEYDIAIKEIPVVYNQTLTQNLAPYVVDEVLRQLSYIKDLKTGGYIVKVNIDLDYQQTAQKALIKGYNNINERLYKSPNTSNMTIPENDNLNGAIVVTKSDTGEILALVGGVDYEKSNFNRATQAQRQFGSAVKPFIYQIAFDMGYSPASEISDIARSFSNTYNNDLVSDNKDIIEDIQSSVEESEESKWQPKNYTNNLSGIVTLKEALSRSLNLAILNLVDNIGFNKIYNIMVNDYGFYNMQKDMSIILGSFVLSPIDVIKYYSIFANYGSMVEPKLINSILNDNNEELLNTDSYINNKEITTPQQAYLTIETLKNAVMKGSGRRAFVNNISIAGKTGTSSKNVDAWFSGFSPSLQVVIWYGRDDNTPIGAKETGGVIAAPVFADFFTNLLKIEPGLKRNFDIPEGVYKRSIKGDTFYYTETSKIPKHVKENNINDTLLY